MKIAIVGTGYVGLVTGTCFAEIGVNVICVDTNSEKIESLKKGVIPIYENGLEEMVSRNVKAGRLQFTTSLESCLNEVEVVFSAVGTPPDEDGSADLSYVLEVARTIGRNMQKYVLVVTKSTVPVGTARKVRATIQEELDKRGMNIDFDVASNPEFLKEGNAINDFMSPDRVVVGVESERAKKIMSKLYKPFLLNNFRVIFMDIPSAEMTKYAANSMLATRISFMNDIANLCELVGADVNMVRKGIGADSRIGNKFLYPGCGYGGSCFPKDVKALIKTADKYGYSMRDSDSSTYEKTAGWEKEYVNGFMEEAKSGKYDFVFVCQTESVIDEMDRQKIPYVIVEPDNIVWNEQESKERAKERQIIKQQWFGRFVLRNNSHIKDFSKWLSHMKDIYDERTRFDFIAKHNPVSFFVLKQNQYLSDIIDDLYWKKQHCDAYIV